MLRYAMCVTVNIIFIYFDIWHEIHRHTCLAPEGIKKSISGPRPEKVVHHCSKGTRYAKEFFHCRSTFYLEFYQNECQLDQFRRNKNDFVLAMMYTNCFLYIDVNKIEPQI